MGIEKQIRNTALTMGDLPAFQSNAPGQYASKQREYFAPESKTFVQKMARYSNDFFLARVQGIEPDDPQGWGEYLIRMADVVRPSAAITRRFDDYKTVIFADRTIQYIRPGTKIETMGSTWLCTNPMDISGGDGAGIVQRCDAVWNHLDWYGNVLSEPLVIENERANASDSDAQASMYITKGYFNVIAQYNEHTAQIDTNTRIILGKAAYRVTGYADFLTEFTGDYDSRRVLKFVVRYEEPNAALDDMERRVAEGKAFTWQVSVKGAANATAGQMAQYTASSVRKGADAVSSEEHPIDYIWSSSDETVAAVSPTGLVSCVGPGTATITAALAQNSDYSGSLVLTVEEPGTESGVKFTSSVPELLYAFDDVTLSAAYFELGQETDEALEFELGGAAEGSYGFFIGPRAVTVYGYGYSATPLTVTARHGDYSAAVTLRLGGV